MAPPPEMMRTTGTVDKYVKGKQIQVASSTGAVLAFNILTDTVIEGKVKKGARVIVIYQKQEEKMVANKIVAATR